MKHIPLLLICLISICIAGCRHKHQSTEYLTPFASDTIKTNIPLCPDDSLNGCYFYGDIKGYKINKRLNTRSKYFFVDYEITILDLSPYITLELFTFMHFNLWAYDFISEGDTISPFETQTFNPYKRSQKEVMDTALYWAEQRFYANVPKYISYGQEAWFSIYPVWINDNYVTYFVYKYLYSGGAHGNSDHFLQSFDLKSGKILELEDIIKPDCLDKIRKLAAEHMASQNHFDNMKIPTLQNYLDSLNVWKNGTNTLFQYYESSDNEKYNITVEDFPLSNPGLNNVGLVFNYSKYLLTPGCYGCPTVVLTYDEVREYLKEPFCNY